MRISQAEMGRPIEIEFAVCLDYSPNSNHKFYLLQIRPIVDSKETITEDIGAIPDENTIITCNNALGHGINNEIFDVVYVKPEAFNASKNQLIMYDIEKVNNTAKRRTALCADWAGPVGLKRCLAWYSGEMASHKQCARDCRERTV